MARYEIIRTAKDTDERLTLVDSGDVIAKSGAAETASYFSIDKDKRYQTILGFGGAFTESTAYTLSRMSSENRAKAISAYFNRETGHGYNIGRVHIHSCDFALENYTYVTENDESLESFSIDRDKKWVIPLIHDAEAERGELIELLASPWSPPAWMKTNGEMNHGGQLKPEYAGLWALYYAKFLQAYREMGLSMWGITVQNEPAAVQVWDSCIYSAEEERDFVKDHLGPTLEREGFQDVKILVWDHNRDIIEDRVAPIYEDPDAARFVWGTGFHWYVSEEFGNVGKVHSRWPDKHLLFTEGCQEGGVHLGSWKTGERYGRNILGDLNNWNEGFLDWNLVLDETGGPNHVGNLCDAPIIADTVNDVLHFNSSYYYIGHFSRYIQPGSVRIGMRGDASSTEAAAFLNRDGSISAVLMNETSQSKLCVIQSEDGLVPVDLLPHSIVTVRLWGDGEKTKE